jgi:hypothetical protein
MFQLKYSVHTIGSSYPWYELVLVLPWSTYTNKKRKQSKTVLHDGFRSVVCFVLRTKKDSSGPASSDPRPKPGCQSNVAATIFRMFFFFLCSEFLHLESNWLATKIFHAQDLTRKGCQNLSKNICHVFNMSIVRY